MKTNNGNLLKKYNNNHGIALISILIAVAFISIIGSALLYITYSNFQMKVMNNRSKTNFYETDGELVNAVSAIRAYADVPAKADSIVTVDPSDSSKYVYNVVNAMHFAGIDSGIDSNPDDLIWHDSSTGDVFQISRTGTALKTVDGNVTTYTLKDFKVTQKSKDDGNGNYLNTVKTDVVFKMLKQTSGGGGSKGLGECSMISDGQLTVTQSNPWYTGDGSNTTFSFLTLFGDSYYSSYYHGEGATASPTDFKEFNGSGTYTQPGEYKNPSKSKSKEAFYLAGRSKVNFEGEYLSIYGDLVLDKESCLNISHGNLTVYGDIYILDKATLICGGTIYQPQSILPGREEQCCIRMAPGANLSTRATDAYLKTHLYYPNGASKSAPYKAEFVTDTSFDAICTLMNLNDTDPDNDGISQKICTNIVYHDSGKNVTIDPLNGIQNVPTIKLSDGTTPTNGAIDANYYGTKCGIAFARAGSEVGNLDEWQNYILFITAGDSGNQFDLKGSAVRTTLVSSSPIYLNVQAGVYYTKMGSDILNYLTIGKDSTTNPYYKEKLHKFELGLSGARGKDESGNSVSTNSNMNQNNYYSAGDFIDANANKNIQDLFSYGVNGGSGVDTYINSVTFKGYTKDTE